MIVVKVELWPYGRESKAKEIGRTYIANAGGTAERGDYRVAVCRHGTTKVPKEVYDPSEIQATERGRKIFNEAPTATRCGEVFDYPRLSYNVWRLVIRGLRECFPEEK